MSGTSPGEMNEETQKIHVGVQVNLQEPDTHFCLRLPKCSVWILAVAFGLLSIYLGTDYALSFYEPRWQVDQETLDDMGIDGVVLFRKHDRDSDGFLSLEEFEPLSHQMLDSNLNVSIRIGSIPKGFHLHL